MQVSFCLIIYDLLLARYYTKFLNILYVEENKQEVVDRRAWRAR